MLTTTATLYNADGTTENIVVDVLPARLTDRQRFEQGRRPPPDFPKMTPQEALAVFSEILRRR